MNDGIDEINRINEDYRKDHSYKSPGDQSQWRKSAITSLEQDEKRSMVEGILGDLENQRADIDSIKIGMEQILQMVNTQTQLLNKLSQGQTGTTVPQTNQPLNLEALSALGDLVEKGVSAYKQLKGGPTPTAPLIDQDFINQRMIQSFKDDLDTGTSITNFIKDSLKKKVTREVINTSLSDMGKDAHAPQ